jgi:hypothetical protein
MVAPFEQGEWSARSVGAPLLLRQAGCFSSCPAFVAEVMLRQLDSARAGLERFLPQLQEWGAQELERRGRGRRTLPLFHGSLSYRRVPASVRVADEGAALNEAAARGLVKIDAAGYRAAALEARKQTGELLPGVEIVPEHEKFSIRFGKGTGGEEAGE